LSKKDVNGNKKNQHKGGISNGFQGYAKDLDIERATEAKKFYRIIDSLIQYMKTKKVIRINIGEALI
jgi:hypothetical protein